MKPPRSAPVRMTLTTLTTAVLLVPGMAGPAFADLPSTQSTYKDTFVSEEGYPATLKLRVGDNKHKFALVKLVVDCGPRKDKWVFRNKVPILDSGDFRVHLSQYDTLRGTFTSPGKAEGFATANLHCHFTADFKATKV